MKLVHFGQSRELTSVPKWFLALSPSTLFPMRDTRAFDILGELVRKRTSRENGCRNRTLQERPPKRLLLKIPARLSKIEQSFDALQSLALVGCSKVSFSACFTYFRQKGAHGYVKRLRREWEINITTQRHRGPRAINCFETSYLRILERQCVSHLWRNECTATLLSHSIINLGSSDTAFALLPSSSFHSSL